MLSTVKMDCPDTCNFTRNYHFRLDPGTERYSLGFTLRDSPTDFVNVTCWGTETFIMGIAKSFKLNDIGKNIF